MRGKLSQTWSLDLILAAGIFILFIIGFYVVLSDQSDPDVQSDLEDTANDISIKLDERSGNPAGIISKGSVDETKLNALTYKDYQQLKGELGVSSDFCIFLEDENGRLIPINNSVIGIGGSEILINGQPCNATLP